MKESLSPQEIVDLTNFKKTVVEIVRNAVFFGDTIDPRDLADDLGIDVEEQV